MKKTILVILSIVALHISINSYAFGLGDVVGAAINAGSKLGSAAAGKAMDSFRDPEKEEADRKKQEQKTLDAFNRAVDEVEARKDLTPFQREKLVLSLQDSYGQSIHMMRFVAQAEERQRADRDQIFTAQGLAGVTIDSVAAMPSATFARADSMVKAGAPQRQANDVMSRIDNSGNINSVKQNPIGAVAEGANQAAAQKTVQDNVEKQGTELKAMMDETKKEELPGALQTAPQKPTFFSPDLGRKLFVEFKGSQKLTSQMRDQLAKQGHTIADDPSQADVTYLIEGEYKYRETTRYEGFHLDAGAFYDNPKDPEPAKEKLSGKIKSSIFSGLLLMSKAQAQMKGQQPSQVNIPNQEKGITQSALLVAARQANGEKEYRISSLQRSEGTDVAAPRLLNAGLADLLEKLGVALD